MVLLHRLDVNDLQMSCKPVKSVDGLRSKDEPSVKDTALSSAKVSSKVIKVKDVNMFKHQLKKGKRTQRKVLCPVCHKIFYAHRKVTKHVKKYYTDYKFTCAFATRYMKPTTGGRNMKTAIELLNMGVIYAKQAFSSSKC